MYLVTELFAASVGFQGSWLEGMIVVSCVDGGNVPERCNPLWGPDNDAERAVGTLRNFVAMQFRISMFDRLAFP